jgi:hypothetical protein
MKIIITSIAILPAITVSTVFAEDKEYRPGGKEYAPVRIRFYAGDHEPELDDPLIKAGKKIEKLP